MTWSRSRACSRGVTLPRQWVPCPDLLWNSRNGTSQSLHRGYREQLAPGLSGRVAGRHRGGRQATRRQHSAQRYLAGHQSGRRALHRQPGPVSGLPPSRTSWMASARNSGGYAAVNVAPGKLVLAGGPPGGLNPNPHRPRPPPDSPPDSPPPVSSSATSSTSHIAWVSRAVSFVHKTLNTLITTSNSSEPSGHAEVKTMIP